MPDMKEIIKQIQYITYGAYGSSGQVAALLEEPDSQPEAVAMFAPGCGIWTPLSSRAWRASCEATSGM